MKIEDTGFVLDVEKFLDDKRIVKILSKEHGIWRGICSSKMCVPYDFVSFIWSSKLWDNLGYISILSSKSYFVDFFNNEMPLYCLKNISNMMKFVTERSGVADLYYSLESILNSKTKDFFVKEYIYFLVIFLSEVGYPLDLTHCAVTGVVEDLFYVSPKTGRAVTKEKGDPYKDKLLKLPLFFKHFNSSDRFMSAADFVEAIDLCNFFIKKNLENSNNVLIYNNRVKKMLIDQKD